MQAYNQSINDLDKELDTLKSGFEVQYVTFMLLFVRCLHILLHYPFMFTLLYYQFLYILNTVLAPLLAGYAR
jgi:hypothetical protein